MARPNDCSLNFLLVIIPPQAFLAFILIYLGFIILALKILFGSIPLALGLNSGPLVEFWVRLPLFKTQVHVVIALGTPCGIITKTPLTFLATPLGSRDQ